MCDGRRCDDGAMRSGGGPTDYSDCQYQSRNAISTFVPPAANAPPPRLFRGARGQPTRRNNTPNRKGAIPATEHDRATRASEPAADAHARYVRGGADAWLYITSTWSPLATTTVLRPAAARLVSSLHPSSLSCRQECSTGPSAAAHARRGITATHASAYISSDDFWRAVGQ